MNGGGGGRGGGGFESVPSVFGFFTDEMEKHQFHHRRIAFMCYYLHPT